MYKQAFRSSIIVVALLTLVSCGGGTSTSANSTDTGSSTASSATTSSATTGSASAVNVHGGNAVVTLNWTTPSQNTDNSALTDLAGYKIYYGSSPSSLNNRITISNSSINTFLIENLTSGITVYFAVVAYNSTGIESSLSNVSSKAT